MLEQKGGSNLISENILGKNKIFHRDYPNEIKNLINFDTPIFLIEMNIIPNLIKFLPDKFNFYGDSITKKNFFNIFKTNVPNELKINDNYIPSNISTREIGKIIGNFILNHIKDSRITEEKITFVSNEISRTYLLNKLRLINKHFKIKKKFSNNYFLIINLIKIIVLVRENEPNIKEYYEGVNEILTDTPYEFDMSKYEETVSIRKLNFDESFLNNLILAHKNVVTPIEWNIIKLSDCVNKYPECGATSLRNFILTIIYNKSTNSFDLSKLETLGATEKVIEYFSIYNSLELHKSNLKKDFNEKSLSSREAWSEILCKLPSVHYRQEDCSCEIASGLNKLKLEPNMLTVIKKLFNMKETPTNFDFFNKDRLFSSYSVKIDSKGLGNIKYENENGKYNWSFLEGHFSLDNNLEFQVESYKEMINPINTINYNLVTKKYSELKISEIEKYYPPEWWYLFLNLKNEIYLQDLLQHKEDLDDDIYLKLFLELLSYQNPNLFVDIVFNIPKLKTITLTLEQKNIINTFFEDYPPIKNIINLDDLLNYRVKSLSLSFYKIKNIEEEIEKFTLLENLGIPKVNFSLDKLSVNLRNLFITKFSEIPDLSLINRLENLTHLIIDNIKTKSSFELNLPNLTHLSLNNYNLLDYKLPKLKNLLIKSNSFIDGDIIETKFGYIENLEIPFYKRNIILSHIRTRKSKPYLVKNLIIRKLHQNNMTINVENVENLFIKSSAYNKISRLERIEYLKSLTLNDYNHHLGDLLNYAENLEYLELNKYNRSLNGVLNGLTNLKTLIIPEYTGFTLQERTITIRPEYIDDDDIVLVKPKTRKEKKIVYVYNNLLEIFSHVPNLEYLEVNERLNHLEFIIYLKNLKTFKGKHDVEYSSMEEFKKFICKELKYEYQDLSYLEYDEITDEDKRRWEILTSILNKKYFKKYLKYKSKYLKLRSNFNN